jgi:hypothetical protein
MNAWSARPGKSANPVQPRREKYSASLEGQITGLMAHLTRLRGRLAIVTNVAVRCGGRKARERRACAVRTAKACGPDAPVLASSRWEIFLSATVARKPITEEGTR